MSSVEANSREVLLKGEGSVRLTSLYYPVKISCFDKANNIYFFIKTSYFNEEVKRTEPSRSVRVPC